MLAFSDVPYKERIIVALDCDKQRALELADMLAGKATWMKVGLTLFLAEGAPIINELKSRGFKVFLDLKLHDIPHQVRGAAASLVGLGADMLTVHTSGASDMMKAALEGVADSDNPPAVIGVTVLTSMDAQDLEDLGISRPMELQVTELAQLAKRSGLSGVVASPMEAATLRELLGPDALIVTPGVRPAGSDVGDQSRVATPAAAFEAGASHIVIGRPITEADDPAAAFDSIVEGL